MSVLRRLGDSVRGVFRGSRLAWGNSWVLSLLAPTLPLLIVLGCSGIALQNIEQAEADLVAGVGKVNDALTVVQDDPNLATAEGDLRAALADFGDAWAALTGEPSAGAVLESCANRCDNECPSVTKTGCVAACPFGCPPHCCGCKSDNDGCDHGGCPTCTCSSPPCDAPCGAAPIAAVEHHSCEWYCNQESCNSTPAHVIDCVDHCIDGLHHHPKCEHLTAEHESCYARCQKTCSGHNFTDCLEWCADGKGPRCKPFP